MSTTKQRRTVIVLLLSMIVSAVVVSYIYWHSGRHVADRRVIKHISVSAEDAQQQASFHAAGNTVGKDGHEIAEKVTSLDGFIVVNVEGKLTDRLAAFNTRLSSLRHEELVRLDIAGARTIWQGPISSRVLDVLSATSPDYLQILRANYSSRVMTAVLPWTYSTSWSSNILLENYYQWTADDRLCTWIETPPELRSRQGNVLTNRTCSRNINDAIQPTPLVYFRRRSVHHKDSPHFYTTTPQYVFLIHIHRDALVTEFGDVIAGNVKLVLHTCAHDVKPVVPAFHNLESIPLYQEIYVITQFHGTAVFHRMAEIVPRLALCLDFLKANPQIRILGPEGGGRLAELVEIIGLNSSRLVTGLTRARIVYQPRSTGCGVANVQESQLTSQLYRNYIRRTFPAQPRNRLILIRRSRSRRFTEHRGIERVLERAAVDYNLTYEMFIDNPVPSLNHTMIMFHSAVIVVAPHGAGLSNLYFSQPGTYVIEGVCNRPHVNMCFQRLTHILGHRWHGLMSRGGCTRIISISKFDIDSNVRRILHLWKHNTR